MKVSGVILLFSLLVSYNVWHFHTKPEKAQSFVSHCTNQNGKFFYRFWVKTVLKTPSDYRLDFLNKISTRRKIWGNKEELEPTVHAVHKYLWFFLITDCNIFLTTNLKITANLNKVLTYKEKLNWMPLPVFCQRWDKIFLLRLLQNQNFHECKGLLFYLELVHHFTQS